MTAEMNQRVMNEIIHPTVRAMKAMGAPYKGVLFAGLMITKDGPQLIEYNVRFGDPECQVLMKRLKSDLLPLLVASAEGKLAGMVPEWSDEAALCVVMAAKGYPGPYDKGLPIRGLEEAEKLPDVKVFHAGTTLDKDGRVTTSGGRVLNVTALGESISVAKLNAYRAVKCIRWDGAWCRKDISDKAVKLQK